MQSERALTPQPCAKAIRLVCAARFSRKGHGYAVVLELLRGRDVDGRTPSTSVQGGIYRVPDRAIAQALPIGPLSHLLPCMWCQRSARPLAAGCNWRRRRKPIPGGLSLASLPTTRRQPQPCAKAADGGKSVWAYSITSRRHKLRALCAQAPL